MQQTPYIKGQKNVLTVINGGNKPQEKERRFIAKGLLFDQFGRILVVKQDIASLLLLPGLKVYETIEGRHVINSDYPAKLSDFFSETLNIKIIVEKLICTIGRNNTVDWYYAVTPIKPIPTNTAQWTNQNKNYCSFWITTDKIQFLNKDIDNVIKAYNRKEPTSLFLSTPR